MAMLVYQRVTHQNHGYIKHVLSWSTYVYLVYFTFVEVYGL
jgi:hypothetical protein